jgi:hypothetical protein
VPQLPRRRLRHPRAGVVLGALARVPHPHLNLGRHPMKRLAAALLVAAARVAAWALHVDWEEE